jgi:DNA repair protein SbcC/Rad50
MISSIRIKDFQAHKDFELSLDPSITTIQGNTDVGKSAILRALNWVCLNGLAGDSFIREGAKAASVSIVIGKNKITRTKGKGKNTYKLNANVFKSFSTSVPDTIATVLGVSDINFQGQFDSPFWFCDTAGSVSKQLNAIVDLKVIDSSLSWLASKVREAQKVEELRKDTLHTLRGELAALGNVKERIQHFNLLKATYERVQQFKEDSYKLEGVIQAIHNNSAAMLERKAKKLQSLYIRGKRAFSFTRQESSLNFLLNSFPSEKKAPPTFEPIQKAYEAWKELAGSEEHLSSLLHGYKSRTAETQSTLKVALATFASKTKGQICPLCASPLQF